MATTPVAPPPAAAPAAAPPPAPPAASTPAAAPPPAASAPAAPPPVVPAAGAPPSTPQPPAKLNPGAYHDAVESYQAEVTYRQQLAEFKAAHPEIEVKEESAWASDEPAAEAKPGEAPAAEAPAAETKPAEAEAPAPEAPAAEEEQYSLAEDSNLTPQALNDLIKANPERQAFLDGDGEFKGAIFKLAREHAELKQFQGIFPTAQSATFAKGEANWLTTVVSKIQTAETPKQIDEAIEMQMERFQVKGADGKPVLDADGSPQYEDDGYRYAERWVDRYIEPTLAEVDARLAANQYANEADRERDNDMKLALSIIQRDIHPSNEPKPDPDLSHLPDEARKEVQARLDEAKKIESENAAKAAGAGKQNREQIRKEGTQKFFADAGKRTFDQVDKIVASLRKAGAVIPDWQLEAKMPGTNISAFKNAVGTEIEQFIKADPYLFNQQLQLEMQYLARPTPENMQERVKAFDGILQTRDETGKSLLNRIVTKLVRKYGSQVQAAAEGATVTEAPAASREPVQGGPPRPHVMTADDAWKEAEKQLGTERKDWHTIDQAERLSALFARQRQLLTQKG